MKLLKPTEMLVLGSMENSLAMTDTAQQIISIIREVLDAVNSDLTIPYRERTAVIRAFDILLRTLESHYGPKPSSPASTETKPR